MASSPSRGGRTGTYLTTQTAYDVTVNYGDSRAPPPKEVPGSGWFGPLQPLVPIAPEGVESRQFDFPSGYNLSTIARPYKGLDFPTLRAMADGWDLLRLVIETRKDQAKRLRWTVQPKDRHTKKNVDDQIKVVTEFFQKPDGFHTFSEWLGILLEDLFVIDAPAIYKQRNRSGKLIELLPIDGATIKPVIDNFGRTPRPYKRGRGMVYPVAYQQILKGYPALDYSLRDLIYKPRNVRVHSVYGFSPVESIVATVTLALRRQSFTTSYFTEGNIPDSLIGVPDNWCYSDDTEVLTDRGWKLFTEVDIAKDMFATRSVDGEFQWQKATGINLSPYKGDMVALKSRTIDCLVNPPHRVLIASHMRDGRIVERIKLAGDLLEKHSERERIPVTSTWDGLEVGTQIFQQETACGGGRDLIMTGDQYCAFMGAYLSEGSKNSRNAFICQPKNGNGFTEYYSLLTDILGHEPSYNKDSLVISNAPLARHLDRFSTASNKFVPKEIMGATARQIRIFLNHYSLGDGSKNGKTIYTSSLTMASQLQELVQKIGKSATIGIDDRRGRIANIGDREVSTNYINYRVHISDSKIRKFSVSSESYDGLVGCVSVPNGILYVRRNGCPCWSGNTPDQIAVYQKYWDTYLEGDDAKRRKAKFVPGGVAKTFIQTKEPDLKAEFDDWLSRIVCFAFSVSPQALIKQMNRASADTQKAQAEEEGLVPIMAWIKELVDSVVQDELDAPDVEFVFSGEDSVDESTQAVILDGYAKAGVMSLNEIRVKIGLVPLLDPAFSEPMVYTALGYVPIGANTIEGMKEKINEGIMPQSQPPGAGGGSAPQGTGPGKPAATKPKAQTGPGVTARKATGEEDEAAINRAEENGYSEESINMLLRLSKAPLEATFSDFGEMMEWLDAE